MASISVNSYLKGKKLKVNIFLFKIILFKYLFKEDYKNTFPLKSNQNIRDLTSISVIFNI